MKLLRVLTTKSGKTEYHLESVSATSALPCDASSRDPSCNSPSRPCSPIIPLHALEYHHVQCYFIHLIMLTSHFCPSVSPVGLHFGWSERRHRDGRGIVYHEQNESPPSRPSDPALDTLVSCTGKKQDAVTLATSRAICPLRKYFKEQLIVLHAIPISNIVRSCIFQALSMLCRSRWSNLVLEGKLRVQHQDV